MLQKVREAGRNPDSKEFEKIRAAESPMQMWIELWLRFESAHRDPVDREFIKKIYEYAAWCITDASRGVDAGTDPSTAAWVCFFEHLPMSPRVLDMVGEFLTVEQVQKLREAFLYFRGEEGFLDLLHRVRDWR